MGIQKDYYSADGAAGMAVSQFFLGATPDETHFNDLSDFTTLQENYYAAHGAVDPQLAGYEAIGRSFASDPAFASKLALGTDATSYFATTYAGLFGHAGGAEQVQHFVDQENYFIHIFTNAGMSAEDAASQARGAALGQLIGFAVQDGTTSYGQGVANFYGDAADGNIVYGQSLFAYSSAPPPAPGHDVTYVLNGTLDVTSTKNFAGVEQNFGAGNLVTDFQIAKDATDNTEMGIHAHYNTGDSVQATQDGTAYVFNMEAGYRSGIHNEQGTNVNRSHASLDLSMNFGTDGPQDGELVFRYDNDSSAAANMHTLTLAHQGTNWYFADENGTPVLGMTLSADGHVLQDSVNFGFAGLNMPHGAAGTGDVLAGQYAMELVHVVGGVEVATLHADFVLT